MYIFYSILLKLIIVPYLLISIIQNTLYAQSPISLNQEQQNQQSQVQDQNRQMMQQMGYSPPPTQQEINANWQKQNEARQRNGEQQQLNSQQQQRKQLAEVLYEGQRAEPSLNKEYWNVPGFNDKTKSYSSAFNNIRDMLTGKKSLSVKDAYYEIENAWGDDFLSKTEYDNYIKKSADFINQWLFENGYDIKNNIAQQFGLQKFMTDTLVIGKKKNIEAPNKPQVVHLPFNYDYQDYKAERDYRSYHVMKTLATGNGQCHNLPLVYVILAEALGAKAYLSHAPIHDFVKYPDNKGNIHNFEATSNWQISDQWYKDYLYIKSTAEKSRIYLDTLNKEEMVADAMIELACSYKQKFGIGDGTFINQCVDFAMNYFPNKDANIYGWLLRQKTTAVKLDRLLLKNNVKDMNQIKTVLGASELLQQLNAITEKIASLGYQELPDKAYEYMVESQDNKGKALDSLQTDNLQRRETFYSLQR